MTTHEESMRKLVLSFGKMEEPALTALTEPWTEVSFKRKQVITRQGDTEKYLYFVLDGVQRAYSTHGDKEMTLVFSYTGSFSGVIDSFFLRQPSAFCLEAITTGSCLRMAWADMELLMKEHRSIESWVRLAVTRVLADTLKRQIEILALSSEEKLITLLHRSPHVLNIIPHKYLASYIGVDATNFSKMLAKVRLP